MTFERDSLRITLYELLLQPVRQERMKLRVFCSDPCDVLVSVEELKANPELVRDYSAKRVQVVYGDGTSSNGSVDATNCKFSNHAQWVTSLGKVQVTGELDDAEVVAKRHVIES